MKNSLTDTNQEYEVPVHSKNEFWHFLSHMRNMWDLHEIHEGKQFEPKIEFSENSDCVKITAEVPGISEKDLDIEISSDGYLTISGEKKSQTEHNKGENYFSEVSYGMFQRTVPLPWDLEYAKAEADYENGVLKINIPKSTAEKAKKKKLCLKCKKSQQNS